MHHRRDNTSSRKDEARQGHKQARAAERQTLSEGKPKTVRGMHYSTRLAQPPLLDGPSNGNRRKKKTTKWCKGKVGVEHVPMTERDDRYQYLGFVLYNRVCKNCGKHLHGSRWRETP